MILRCVCSHEQQDQLHGKGMRVFNKCAGKRVDIYRCTVCNAEKNHHEAEGKKKK